MQRDRAVVTVVADATVLILVEAHSSVLWGLVVGLGSTRVAIIVEIDRCEARLDQRLRMLWRLNLFGAAMGIDLPSLISRGKRCTCLSIL